MNQKENFRNDLIEWRRKKINMSFARWSEASGLSRSTLYELVKGSTFSPTASTIEKASRALGLNPKYALDSELKRSQFHLAVL